MTQRYTLRSRAHWSEEELVRLCRSNALEHAGKLLSCDPWTEVEEEVLCTRSGAALRLSSRLGTTLLHEADWSGPGWWLCGRVLLQRSPESDAFLQPQSPHASLVRSWQRHWPVVGEWTEALPPLLILCGLGVEWGRVSCLGDGDALLPTSRWEELELCGFQRDPLRPGEVRCPQEALLEALSLLIEQGWHIERQGRPVYLQEQLHLHLGAHGELEGSITFTGKGQLPLQEAWGGNQGWVPLPGGWGLTAPHPLRTMLLPAGEGLRVRRDCPQELLASLEVLSPEHPWRSEGPAHPAVEFQATLRPYQQEGFRWLHSLWQRGSGGILADEMGLGKTVQVLALCSILQEHSVLIVAPTSLLWNWVHELRRFLPGRPWHLYHGTGRHLPTCCRGQVIITSYGMVRSDPQLAEVAWDLLVLDEAQYTKSARTQLTQAVHRMHAHCRIAVSGTPVENHPEELWNHLRFLEPHAAGSKEAFVAASTSTLGVQQLRHRLRSVILRRRKQEVLQDLPPLIEKQLLLTPTERQQELYEQLRRPSQEQATSMPHILAQLTRLRQVCCSPQLLGDPEEGAKLRWLALALEAWRAEGQSILVFSQFAQLLQVAASSFGGSQALLTGATRDRQRVVERFQRGEEPILWCSLKAAGVGLNLQRADTVVLMDPWWNCAAEQQAVDRAHRIGREAPVSVFRILIAGTVEEKVIELSSQKAQMVASLLDAEEGGGALLDDPSPLAALRQLLL